MNVIPDYATMMLPILRRAASGELTNKIAVEAVRMHFNLTQEQISQLLPSGLQTVVSNRAAWATAYLNKAALLARVRRGVYQITDRGNDVLREGPSAIDAQYLKRFPEFLAYISPRGNDDLSEREVEQLASIEREQTPEERLDQAARSLSTVLKQDLLDRILAASPTFFEKLVVKLLIAMGYGGTLAEAGQHIGGPGDGGVDGVIKLDALGIDKVYIQAKRYASDVKVGRKEIQAFSGALDDKQTTRGVFITTSQYTGEAKSYVRGIAKQIVLIAGEELADLLLRYEVGVRTDRTISVRRLDEDFFDE